MGQRIAKHVYDENFQLQKSTYYILDASGNVMATYDKEINYAESTTYFKLKERYIYGSSRVGVRNSDLDVLPLPDKNFSMTTVHYSIGSRTYELSNHLGNVLSVISDKVIPVFPYSNVISEMRADIRVAQDYSPFGVTLDKRNFVVSEGYRYGFQGQEKVDEVSGKGNSYTAEFWQYDSRLARRWNIDPVVKEHESPYACFANNPIWFADPSGADSAVAAGSTTWQWYTESGDTYQSISNRTGVAVEDLRCYNPDIATDKTIPTGKLINISDPNCPAPATLAPIVTSVGTITIGIYDPYTHPTGTDRHLNCGVIFYPNKDQTANFYWYQTIGTNDPAEGNSGANDRKLASNFEYKNDNTAGMRASERKADAFLAIPKGNTGYLPYSNNQVWYPGEGVGHYDKPWRNATSSGKVEWSAILCLYIKNGSAYTRIATMQYGFSITQSGVLEPAIFRANPNFGKNSSDTQGKAEMQNHIKMFNTRLNLPR